MWLCPLRSIITHKMPNLVCPGCAGRRWRSGKFTVRLLASGLTAGFPDYAPNQNSAEPAATAFESPAKASGKAWARVPARAQCDPGDQGVGIHQRRPASSKRWRPGRGGCNRETRTQGHISCQPCLRVRLYVGYRVFVEWTRAAAVEVLPVLGHKRLARRWCVRPPNAWAGRRSPSPDRIADDLIEIGQDAGQGAVKDRPLIGGANFPRKGNRPNKAPAARDRRRDPERRRR